MPKSLLAEVADKPRDENVSAKLKSETISVGVTIILEGEGTVGPPGKRLTTKFPTEIDWPLPGFTDICPPLSKSCKVQDVELTQPVVLITAALAD